jgi:hypothetical protein
VAGLGDGHGLAGGFTDGAVGGGVGGDAGGDDDVVFFSGVKVQKFEVLRLEDPQSLSVELQSSRESVFVPLQDEC